MRWGCGKSPVLRQMSPEQDAVPEGNSAPSTGKGQPGSSSSAGRKAASDTAGDANVPLAEPADIETGVLGAFIESFPRPTRFVVAFSGGPDSLALLHAFSNLIEGRDRLHALHVDHRLHPDSRAWADHCEEICRGLGVGFTAIRVDGERGFQGKDDEAAARQARYAAFENFIDERDVLCTAHCEDDQAETLLINLFRGSGARGLGGIPALRPLGAGRVARPLLSISRQALRSYAKGTGLAAIRDPANEDRRFARALLRHRVMPEIARRWPKVHESLARTATLVRESVSLNDALARIDLETAGEKGIEGDTADTLDTSALRTLTPARRRNAIAFWLRGRGIESPPARRLEEIAGPLIEARPDATPCVRLGAWDLRRFRARLWLVPHRRPDIPGDGPHPWTIPDRLVFPHGLLKAVAKPSASPAEEASPAQERGVGDRDRDRPLLDARVVGRSIDVHFRPSPHIRQGQRGTSLKKRFQHLRIPPWERDRIPLIHVDGALAAIAGIWVHPRFAASSGDGWRIVWEPVVPRSRSLA